MKKTIFILLSLIIVGLIKAQSTNQKPMNIIFILSDDHRYDFMGFMNTVPGLQTPGMDKIGLQLRDELYNWLEKTNGLQIPLKKTAGT